MTQIKDASLKAFYLIRMSILLFVALVTVLFVIINLRTNVPVTDWFSPYKLTVNNIAPDGTVYLKYGRLLKRAFKGHYFVRVVDDKSGFPVCVNDLVLDYVPNPARPPEAVVTLNQFVGSPNCNRLLESGGSYTLNVYWEVSRNGYYPTVKVTLPNVSIKTP